MSMEFGNGNLIKLTEEEELVLVKNLFYTSSAYLGKFCRVIEIHRHKELKNPREVCLEALFILSNNMQGKCINLCITYAWHGTSKAVLSQILDNGSNSKGKNIDDGSCRVLYLTQDPEHRAVDSIVSSTPDERGLINVLFCCVIGQDASEKFVSWNPYVDKHVQPLYVLTVRLANKVEKLLKNPGPIGQMPAALAVLSEILSPEVMYLLRKYFIDFMERRINWVQLLEKTTGIVGRPLLKQVLVSLQNKEKEIKGSLQKEEIIGHPKDKQMKLLLSTQEGIDCTCL